MFKLALDAGHGYNTAGKRCLKSIDPNETREWTLNSRICDKLQAALKEYDGVEVKRMDDTTGKTDVSLSKRCNLANSWGADFYLSVHHNAGINGGSGGGLVVYRYNKLSANGETAKWQKVFYDELIKAGVMKGNRAEPINTASFAVLKDTKMKAVLLECCFMDSTTDTPIILTEEFADKVVKGCINALVKLAGIKKKVVKTENQEQPKPQPQVQTTPQTQPTNTEPKKETTNKYFPKYPGKSNSIVDALKSLGINSSLRYRGKIAKANGIVRNELLFVGLASHNSKMLNLLKQGKLIKP